MAMVKTMKGRQQNNGKIGWQITKESEIGGHGHLA